MEKIKSRDHQQLMDEVYNYWREQEKIGNNISKIEACNHFSNIHRMAVALGNLNYQVKNGGFSQWDGNGYAEEDLEYLLNNLSSLNEDDYPLLSKIYNILLSFSKIEEYEEWTEEEYCPECDGDGCNYCFNGMIDEEYDNYEERILEMDKLNNKYYALNGVLEEMQKFLNNM